MGSSPILPWHVDHWKRVRSQVAADRLPHAILLAGPTGLGKRLFANRLMNWLLCAENDSQETACGTCANCLLMEAGTHPDRFVLSPEEGSEQIKIDQVRDMIGWAYQTAQRAEGKFVLIDPAEGLNDRAANALLKCLEEPPAGTHFLLIADTPGQLIPTIRSRSSTLFFRTPGADVALEWLREQPGFQPDHSVLLNIAGGAPLAVQAMVEADYLATRATVLRLFSSLRSGSNPVSEAVPVNALESEQVVGIMISLIIDLVRVVRGDRNVRHADVVNDLASLADGIDERGWFALLDYLTECRELLASGANPNEQLMIEGICTLTAQTLGLNNTRGVLS